MEAGATSELHVACDAAGCQPPLSCLPLSPFLWPTSRLSAKALSEEISNIVTDSSGSKNSKDAPSAHTEKILLRVSIDAPFLHDVKMFVDVFLNA